MTFPEMCEALSKGRQFVAMLPDGPILTMTKNGVVQNIRTGKPYTYVGKWSDYVSIEWRVFTFDQLQQMRQQQQ
jgi:hypothetical protein